jgi:hypothetical protein
VKNALKACLVVAAAGGAGATALCCFAGLVLVSMGGSSTTTEQTHPLATLRPDLDTQLPNIDEPSNLIVDAPTVLREPISSVEEILGQPVEIWYPGEAGSPLAASETGQWRVYKANLCLIDVRFGADGRAHEIDLGVSYEGLDREGYDLEVRSASELLARMGMSTDLSDRRPDDELYTESGDPWAWRWDNLEGYEVLLLANEPTGHIWQVKISR